MKALILAAGMGNRLGGLTDNRPKALVPVEGQPLIAHALAFLRHPAITAIGVVGGFCYDQLRDCLSAVAPAVRCMENRQYALGSIESLFAARAFCDGDFLLLNADHLYRPTMMDRMVTVARDITAMCDFDRTLVADDMKIRSNGTGYVHEIHKGLTTYDGGYIGVTYCAAAMNDTYWRAAAEVRERHGPTAPVEWILGTLAADGTPARVGDVSGIGWAEVDTPDDLRRAERFLAT